MQRIPPEQRRDQKVCAMVTTAEKHAVDRVARELGMSLSNAGRYLIMRGIAAHEQPRDTP